MHKKRPVHHTNRLLMTDVARLLGVHRNTVRAWVQTGVLMPTVDGLARFLREYTDWRGRLPH